MHSWWLSSRRMTVNVLTDDAGIIRRSAPITRVFIGQPLTNLYNWMRAHGRFRIRQLS